MLEWTEFQRCCREIEALSINLNDGWHFVVQQDEPGCSYLEKRSVIKAQSRHLKDVPSDDCPAADFGLKEELDCESVVENNQEALRCVYNIVYSVSYSVPVLYFNIWKQDGSLLPLPEVWSMVPDSFQGQLKDVWWSTITQQEHPILRTPFFQLHPCKTAQLMDQVLPSHNKEHANYIVTWLSSMAPLVGLDLPNGYSALTAARQ